MIACRGEEIEKSRTGKGRDGRDGSESFAVKVGRWGKIVGENRLLTERISTERKTELS